MSRALQTELDRLVDGDLTPRERRQLLAALADEPGGWQRCALAFLEAQSWRKACRTLTVAADGTPGTRVPSVAPLRARRRDLRRLAASIVTAAALLGLVFCGGLATGRTWPVAWPRVAEEDPAPDKTAKGSSAQGAPQAATARENGTHDAKDKDAPLLMHVLGFIHVPGEDGSRHAVPILAAPGLKVDAPQRHDSQHVAESLRDSHHVVESLRDAYSCLGETRPRVAIPPEWVSTIAPGQSVY
jgi:hypothetical protein